jgi:hypothetical protein
MRLEWRIRSRIFQKRAEEMDKEQLKEHAVIGLAHVLLLPHVLHTYCITNIFGS